MAVTTATSANTTETVIENGKIVEGRMLIPLRAVSEELGSNVTWNQGQKSITITKGEHEVVLIANSRNVKINGIEMQIDVPAQIDRGTTYVPLRFINQVFGGFMEWYQAEKEARITLDGKRLIVRTEPSAVINPVPLSQQQLQEMITKANEAVDPSQFSQIRTHFRPDFTDTLINKIIQQNGVRISELFNSKPNIQYRSNNEAIITQTEIVANGYLDRYLTLTRLDNKWKVTDIQFRISSF
ncbi:copper amine oxidase N-terminal domain-containing protein [Bacillus horti]|uniref:Flagellar basal body P-ring protein FlgI n=1 Tax=Caldalkalibacillus horti TaxID=77523 RepID=A0ABT9VYV0_9BACI|nr:copper amine oxidase N-terminal domain-containing protein [Bacillus horti]MDQ0166178.1 flagellar basal body P-ring protein FlgI [Bacillus horti]